MKNKYLLLTILLGLIFGIIIFFHNQIINFSLPLIKNNILNELNISDNDKTKLEIKTDFSNNIIVLNIEKPIFNDNIYFKNGYANLIVIEKKFSTLLNNKINKIIINNLNIEVINEDINKTKTPAFDDLIPNQLYKTNKFKQIIISNSFIDLSSVVQNHKINIKKLNFENYMNNLDFDGLLLNDKSENQINIITSKNDQSLNIKVNLESYPLSFLKDSISNSLAKNAFNKYYNGKFNIKLNKNLKDFEFKYELLSENDEVFAIGNYNSRNNKHDYDVNMKGLNLTNIIKNEKILNFLKLSQLGDINLEIHSINNFKDYSFEIKNNNNKFFAKGIMKSGNINDLKVIFDDVSINELVKNKEFLRYKNLFNIDIVDIEFNSRKNFNNISFFIKDKNDKIDISGIIKDNKIYKFDFNGEKIKIKNFAKNIYFQDLNLPFWINDKIIDNNFFNINANYLSNSKILDINIIDKYENNLKIEFDSHNNILNKLNLFFFNDEENLILWNKSDNSFSFSFNKKFNNSLYNNFNQDILNLLKFDFIEDYEKIDIKTKFDNNFKFNSKTFKNINNTINNVSISILNSRLNKKHIMQFNNYIELNGNIDINYNHNNNIKYISLNLDDMDINIEKIKYYKKRNTPLNLNFNYIKNDEKILLKNLNINSKKINIIGDVEILDNTIKRVSFDSFKFLKNDIVFNLNQNLNKENKKDYNINITGNLLDLSFIDVKKTKSQFKDIKINIMINTKKLLYINDTNFENANLRGKFENVWQNMEFKGSYDTGGELNINIKPQKNKRFVNINSSNAEKTLNIKKITKSITGGQLKFSGEYNSLDNDEIFTSKLFLRNFAIKKKSKLAGFIKVIRIFDIKQQLKGDTEDFEYAEMKINKNGKVFIIDKGKAYGGLMALTVKGIVDKKDDSLDIKGMVAPTYAIDSWIGKIPIIGNILTGGEGVVAANYTVKGTVKEPKYFVNPLSILTPGIFKEFWKIFELPKSQKIN